MLQHKEILQKVCNETGKKDDSDFEESEKEKNLLCKSPWISNH